MQIIYYVLIKCLRLSTQVSENQIHTDTQNEGDRPLIWNLEDQ